MSMTGTGQQSWSFLLLSCVPLLMCSGGEFELRIILTDFVFTEAADQDGEWFDRFVDHFIDMTRACAHSAPFLVVA